jgi:hypothetical protein
VAATSITVAAESARNVKGFIVCLLLKQTILGDNTCPEAPEKVANEEDEIRKRKVSGAKPNLWHFTMGAQYH